MSTNLKQKLTKKRSNIYLIFLNARYKIAVIARTGTIRQNLSQLRSKPNIKKLPIIRPKPKPKQKSYTAKL